MKCFMTFGRVTQKFCVHVVQHLSRDLIFVVSDKMTQIKYFFCRMSDFLYSKFGLMYERLPVL